MNLNLVLVAKIWYFIVKISLIFDNITKYQANLQVVISFVVSPFVFNHSLQTTQKCKCFYLGTVHVKHSGKVKNWFILYFEEARHCQFLIVKFKIWICSHHLHPWIIVMLWCKSYFKFPWRISLEVLGVKFILSCNVTMLFSIMMS